MKPSIKTLAEIFYSPSQWVIPVFQRNYRWEEPQWRKLWISLEEVKRPDKKGNHFMGFLVFLAEAPQPGENIVYHLIDGQQRLTTLAVLLAAIGLTGAHMGAIPPMTGFQAFLLSFPIAVLAMLFGLIGLVRTSAPECRPRRPKAAAGIVLATTWKSLKSTLPHCFASGRPTGVLNV